MLNSKKTILRLGWLLKQGQSEARILGILQKNWKIKPKPKQGKNPNRNKNPTKHSSKDNKPLQMQMLLPSLSLSLSGLALGPVSDQSPLSRRRLTGGWRNWGREKKRKASHGYVLQYRILSLNINLYFLKSPKFISATKTQNVSLMFRKTMNKHNIYQQNARVLALTAWTNDSQN